MNKRPEPRIERDSLGEVQIPGGAYWGIRTARARDSLTVSGQKAHPRLLEATILVKKAAAQANADTARLNPELSRAIVQAADEVISGQWREQFVIDPYLSGAGQAHNNNVNEVLANRAAEILGGPPGTYTIIHPDRHVNLSQSSNDVFPTAMRLAVLLSLKEFEPVLLDLERLLRRKSLEFDKIIKVGRTHLQDAAPISLGQEFDAFGSSVERSLRRIRDASQNLLELNIGGTEVGTGIDAEPGYTVRVVERLAQLSGFRLRSADDYFRVSQSMADFVEFSSSLKELAVELIKIANDLRLLSSGPQAGFAEIKLPVLAFAPSCVLPGVLPDKSDPVLVECLNMVAFQVIGNDTAVTLAAQAGQLEINVMMPLVIHNILGSIDLLRNALVAFNQRCVTGITANFARIRELLEASGMAGAALVPILGFETACSLVRESLSTGESLRQLVLDKALMSADAFEKALQQKSIVQPGGLRTTGDTTAGSP